jgi:hypothetical protein
MTNERKNIGPCEPCYIKHFSSPFKTKRHLRSVRNETTLTKILDQALVGMQYI